MKNVCITVKHDHPITITPWQRMNNKHVVLFPCNANNVFRGFFKYIFFCFRSLWQSFNIFVTIYLPRSQVCPRYPETQPRQWPVLMSHRQSWQLMGHCWLQFSPKTPFLLQPLINYTNYSKTQWLTFVIVEYNIIVILGLTKKEIILDSGFWYHWKNLKLTINFQLTQFIVCKFRIIARINNTYSTFVIVNDITSVNRTIDSLIL